MALSKQKFREIVFQLLFSTDFSSVKEKETAEMLMEQLSVPKSTLREALLRAEKMTEFFPEIDRKIASLSKGYEFDRIPRVEKTILRLGLFEILHDSSLPPKVVISEAIRLSRKFASPEASAFVNAVLDSAHKEESQKAEGKSQK